ASNVRSHWRLATETRTTVSSSSFSFGSRLMRGRPPGARARARSSSQHRDHAVDAAKPGVEPHHLRRLPAPHAQAVADVLRARRQVLPPGATLDRRTQLRLDLADDDARDLFPIEG